MQKGRGVRAGLAMSDVRERTKIKTQSNLATTREFRLSHWKLLKAVLLKYFYCFAMPVAGLLSNALIWIAGFLLESGLVLLYNRFLSPGLRV
jgi:hypothetical protein